MNISRGTTPTFEFNFPQTIDKYTSILISFAQNGDEVLDKEKTDLTLITGTTYALPLTQEEINLFDDGIFECQVRVLETNGNVAASKIYRGRIMDVINDTVLEVSNE